MSDFKAKMHQVRFWLGLRQTPLGELTAPPPRPLAGFKGPTSKGRGGRGKGMEGEKEGKERGGKGREEKGRGRGRGREGSAPFAYSWIRPW